MARVNILVTLMYSQKLLTSGGVSLLWNVCVFLRSKCRSCMSRWYRPTISPRFIVMIFSDNHYIPPYLALKCTNSA